MKPLAGEGVWIEIPLPGEKRSTDLGRQGQSDAIRNQKTTLAVKEGYGCLTNHQKCHGKGKEKDVIRRNCVHLKEKTPSANVACPSSLATTHYLSFASVNCCSGFQTSRKELAFINALLHGILIINKKTKRLLWLKQRERA